MQYDRLAALSSGACIKIDNSLETNVESISFELENDKKYEDHISIFNSREVSMDLTVYSDNNRLVVKNPTVTGKTVDLAFNIDTIDLKNGDEISGTLTIISNVGIKTVPYHYSIVTKSALKIAETFNTITDYYDFLHSNFDTAIELFTDSKLYEAPFMKDEFTLSLYEGLIKGTNKNIAIIEFFKAFGLDVTALFKDIDDDIEKRYLSDSYGNIDLAKMRDREGLSKLFAIDGGVDNMAVEDEVTKEATYLIENLRDRELLNVLASMCVRNNYIDKIAFNIYLKVIEKGSNISGIYEKFLLSIPEDYNLKLPLYIYRYYYEDKSFTFDDKLMLYENIISAFDENEDVYRLYSQEILEYAISRIYQNKITESLVNIYNKILSIDIVNENNCNNVLYLLRSHKLIIKNNKIRKVIIKYKETEKETKYDVINNIAYVPIFFDSYFMLYEDVYGNRYFSEEVAIKVLFDKKDIESYIIERFPQKSIIDMTKIIKYNENEKFNNETEISDILELSRIMDISKVVIDKFRNKIVDYYFVYVMQGGHISERIKEYLKDLPFEKLDVYDRRKLLKILLEQEEYKFVYDKIGFYGISYMEDDDLKMLFSKLIDFNDLDIKKKLLNDLFEFSKTRAKDAKVLNYLQNNYDGSLENLSYIMDALSSIEMDASFIAKKILMLSLECDQNAYLDHAFENYDETTDDQNNILVAYLNKKATNYFLDDSKTSDKYFERLTRYFIDNFDKMDELPLIFLLAITKYISTFKTLSNNDLRRILIKAMERLLKLDMVFAYFKKLNRHMRMPYNIMNKEYIEFHADKDFVPKVILSISGDEEKKEIELQKVFMNIYVKRITVYKNEIINFEVINGSDKARGVLMKGTLSYDDNYELEYPARGKIRSTYDYINDAIVCLDRDNIEGLKKVVMDMIEKQEISKKLFNIYDPRNQS